MPNHDVSISTLDGGLMPAYIAEPEGSGPWPTAVVLGELFGLTDVQRDAADRVAAMGYLTVAPHLLHRQAPDPLTEDEEGRRGALAMVQQLTRLELVSDVRDALESVAEEPGADPTAGPIAVGMSFGGHVALLAAALLGLPACVAMYAGWLAGCEIPASQPQATGSLPLAGRLLVLVGQDDHMIPMTDVEALRSWHPGAEIATYPGVGHRFCAVGRPGYDADAATDAWQRVASFLARSAVAPRA